MTTHQPDTSENSAEETTDGHARENRTKQATNPESGAENAIDISALREEIEATEKADPDHGVTDLETEGDGDATGDVDPIVELGISDVDLPAGDGETDPEPEPESEPESEPKPELELELESEAEAEATPETDSEANLESGGEPREDVPENTIESGSHEPKESDEKSLLRSLIEELEDGSLSEEERTALRSGLGVEPPNSVAVRLRHVQEQVDDIVAYRNALEEFIDENGEATEVLDDVRAQFEAIETRIETLETHLSDLEGDLERVENRQQAAFEEIEERIETLETSFDVETRSAEDERTALRERIEECELWRERLNDALAGGGVEGNGPTGGSSRET